MTFDTAAYSSAPARNPGRTHETCPIRRFRGPDPGAGRRGRPVRDARRRSRSPPRRRRPRSRSARTGTSAATSGSASTTRPRSHWRRSLLPRRAFWLPPPRRADPARASRATSASATASTISSGWTRPGIIGRARPVRAPSPSSAPTASRASHNPATGAAAGYLYDTTNTCGGTTSLNQHNNTFLANGYVDLGTYSGLHPIRRRRRRPQHELHAGELQFRRDRERLRLRGQSHEPRRLPLRLGQLGRAADHSAARMSCSRRRTGTARSTPRPIASPGRSRPASASSSTRARRSTSATATSTAANPVCSINPQTGLTVKQRNVSQQILRRRPLRPAVADACVRPLDARADFGVHPLVSSRLDA